VVADPASFQAQINPEWDLYNNGKLPLPPFFTGKITFVKIKLKFVYIRFARQTIKI